MSVYDTQSENTRDKAITAAVDAVRAGQLIVLPTDTVYGIGADAFDAEAVDALLAAKGRGRNAPPPVLVGDPAVLMALAVDVPEDAERLAEEFWPGPLTLILTAQPSLTWDLGETRGTVALRMPDDEVALELLRRTGPLAVSSANRHGKDAALSVLDAATQLGDHVEVYLDGGPARLGTASTIIDMTVSPPEIVRQGALERETIVAALGDIFAAPELEPTPGEESTGESAADSAGEGGETVAGSTAADPTATDDTATDPTAGETASAGAGPLALPSEAAGESAGAPAELDGEASSAPAADDADEVAAEAVPDTDADAAAATGPADPAGEPDAPADGAGPATA
ncbi:L-threonylcarbamoyladenylate synthase [Brachybacterium nesterenkovii]|uniref:L-threonylcarbamoyladenylate synthase n=1 Tax=Brachybacterium nesterenkovii TaxID=47847 RepID=A0A1X6X4N1_9MICO|nr:L-threonylcarbamoyladenylate synthase [Brachybacterium nesterenkovii]SLM93884.1 TsaC protein (YrdC domain) required for threonylcarbamoyladenosine t(6)A37 modification in tRNA [Brachybacterium nesterenkovii]